MSGFEGWQILPGRDSVGVVAPGGHAVIDVRVADGPEIATWPRATERSTGEFEQATPRVLLTQALLETGRLLDDEPLELRVAGAPALMVAREPGSSTRGSRSREVALPDRRYRLEHTTDRRARLERDGTAIARLHRSWRIGLTSPTAYTDLAFTARGAAIRDDIDAAMVVLCGAVIQPGRDGMPERAIKEIFRFV